MRAGGVPRCHSHVGPWPRSLTSDPLGRPRFSQPHVSPSLPARFTTDPLVGNMLPALSSSCKRDAASRSIRSTSLVRRSASLSVSATKRSVILLFASNASAREMRDGASLTAQAARPNANSFFYWAALRTWTRIAISLAGRHATCSLSPLAPTAFGESVTRVASPKRCCHTNVGATLSPRRSVTQHYPRAPVRPEHSSAVPHVRRATMSVHDYRLTAARATEGV
jgi:hypothetical protein